MKLNEKKVDKFIRRWAMKLTNQTDTSMILLKLGWMFTLVLVLSFVIGVLVGAEFVE